METQELLQIRISKVINASRWRVIRQLTKVWQLSSLVPTIKNVSVVEKSHNIVKTKWQIVVDNLPINWVEEDELDFAQNTIRFKSVEGDLKEFRGAWHFADHPKGTEVKIEIYMSVGIPAIGAFAEEYIKTLVTKNFELILDALERRLISQRYISFKKGETNKIAGFGLIGHFYNLNHLAKGLKMMNPNYKIPSPEFLSKLYDVTPSFKIYEMNDYKSKSGEASTNGSIILCTFVPDMIEHNVQSVYDKVVRACKLAEKSGVGIVTLGGFTSIVAERFGNRIVDEVDIPITTGNTYTAALAMEGVRQAAKLLGKDLKDLKAAVIGGTGDIGSACARVLANQVKQVTITGRNRWNLLKLNAELRFKHKAKIEAHRHNRRAIEDADIVISATNASASILKMEWFKPGAIVCDLAYPKNISYNTMRRDIFVFSGGLAAVPNPIELSVMMGLPTPDVCYGCSCEAIVLALDKRFENYSFGRGKIAEHKMDEIFKIGLKHGFTLAPFFWADKMIDQGMIDEIKKASK